MKFHSRIKVFFLLFALGIHMFLGQHDVSASLVLCLGDDGQVSIEVLQHTPHAAAITDHASLESLHSEMCTEQEDCRDISISLDHDEFYVQQRLPEFRFTPVIHDYLVYPPGRHNLPEQDVMALLQLDQRPHTAVRQTLQTTILLI